MTSVKPHVARPYPKIWNLIPILGGLIDLPWGVLVTIGDIFCHASLPKSCDSDRRRRRGLTFVLGGIEGPSKYNTDMVRGILQSGYRGSVVRFDWNRGPPLWRTLANLMSRRHHERQSALLAERILDHHRRHPDAPVCIVAQSGGCWIAVRALEQLPQGTMIDSVVLLAPAISPGYDIRPAVARCRSALISVGSAGDFVFLGLGTMFFGTSDRAFTPSAGFIGWHFKPEGFIEARWHPDWIGLGYFGNHTSTTAVSFIATIIGPKLACAMPHGRAPRQAPGQAD